MTGSEIYLKLKLKTKTKCVSGRLDHKTKIWKIVGKILIIFKGRGAGVGGNPSMENSMKIINFVLEAFPYYHNPITTIHREKQTVSQISSMNLGGMRRNIIISYFSYLMFQILNFHKIYLIMWKLIPGWKSEEENVKN